MDTTINKLLYDLRVISQIDIGDKISISSEQLDINREGILQPILRTLYGDNRGKTYGYIQNTINLAITIMTLMMESGYTKNKDGKYYTMYSLYMAFNGSMTGINNLSITYHADTMIVRQLKELLDIQATFIEQCKVSLNIS